MEITEKRKGKKEMCILCGKETEYYRNTPIDEREHYVEGAGQLCGDCWNGIYPNEKNNCI